MSGWRAGMLIGGLLSGFLPAKRVIVFEIPSFFLFFWFSKERGGNDRVID